MATFVFIDNGRIRPAPGTRVIKASEYAAIGPAIKVYADARKKADDLVENAETIYHSEKKRGYEEGLRKAKQEMAEQMSTLALRTERYYRDMEKQIVQLVMEIVKKVLDDVDPRTRVLAQVKNAMSAFKGRKHLTIKVNPAVAEMLKEKYAELKATYPSIEVIDIKAIPSQPTDNIMMESETGIVEASLEAQLEAIERAIAKELQLPN